MDAGQDCALAGRTVTSVVRNRGGRNAKVVTILADTGGGRGSTGPGVSADGECWWRPV